MVSLWVIDIVDRVIDIAVVVLGGLRGIIVIV
jgi:hypothetical protein